MLSWWWPGRRSRSRTTKPPTPTAAASAAWSPRHSHSHDDATFAFAWAAPSSVHPGWETKPPSLDSPAARRRSTSNAVVPCCGGVSEGAVAVPGQQGFPLPRPKSGPLPEAEGCACASPCTSMSGGCSSESDNAVEDHRYTGISMSYVDGWPRVVYLRFSFYLFGH